MTDETVQVVLSDAKSVTVSAYEASDGKQVAQPGGDPISITREELEAANQIDGVKLEVVESGGRTAAPPPPSAGQGQQGGSSQGDR